MDAAATLLATCTALRVARDNIADVLVYLADGDLETEFTPDSHLALRDSLNEARHHLQQATSIVGIDD